MNKETLIRQLEAIGVPSWRYSLVSDNTTDCTSVVGIGNKWSVIYTDDRGIKNLVAKFNSREDAYDYLYSYFVCEQNFKKEYGII